MAASANLKSKISNLKSALVWPLTESANLQSEICNLKSSLVRLGHLCFDDFLLLGKWGLSRESSSSEGLSPFSPELASDWALALNNTPHVLHHLRRCTNLESKITNLKSKTSPSTSSIASAQTRLVAHFALDLLRAKAPPLYDSLPWHDWDFSIVTKRFPLWKTRFLLAGDGTTVTMCRCRKSAGVYALEPCEAMARYTERKAVLEKVRRFRLLSADCGGDMTQLSSIGIVSQAGGDMTQLSSIGIVSQAAVSSRSSVLKLSQIPLPDHSVDLAIIGSSPELQPADCKLVTQELLRIASNVLLVENNPLAPPLDRDLLADSGFALESVQVRGLGPRPCHWRHSPR